jgi:hypothetical protein
VQVGVIVSKELGLAVVDRATVTIMLGSVSLTIAGVHTIPANIVFLHPYQVCLWRVDVSVTVNVTTHRVLHMSL